MKQNIVLQTELENSIKRFIGDSDNQYHVLLLSGGVDSSAILAACNRAKIPIKFIAITVITNRDAPDFAWSRETAIQYAHLIHSHHILIMSCEDLLKHEIVHIVKTLHSFDPMQNRNSLVISAAIRLAKRLCNSLEPRITSSSICLWNGDGADELFGGYSFCWNHDEPIWTQKRNDMCTDWYFSTQSLCDAEGVRYCAPFADSYFANLMMTIVKKTDCVGEREIALQPGDLPVRHTTGKICLRDAYPDALSSRRRKDPIEVGSGATAMSYPAFWENRLHRTIEDSIKLAKRFGITIRDKEHAEYFHIFSKFCEDLLRSRSLTRQASINGYCVGCGFEMQNPYALFCRTCGAYPARIVTN